LQKWESLSKADFLNPPSPDYYSLGELRDYGFERLAVLLLDTETIEALLAEKVASGGAEDDGYRTTILTSSALCVFERTPDGETSGFRLPFRSITGLSLESRARRRGCAEQPGFPRWVVETEIAILHTAPLDESNRLVISGSAWYDSWERRPNPYQVDLAQHFFQRLAALA